MIAHLLAAATASAASTASTASGGKLHVPPIRYLSILPPIIMIGIKTATSEVLMERTVNPISFEPLNAA